MLKLHSWSASWLATTAVVVVASSVVGGCQSADPLPGAIDPAPSLSNAAITDGCRLVRRNRGLIPIVISLVGSGQACLAEDLKQRHIYDGITGRNRGSPRWDGVISFDHAHNLDLDLRGHLVSGEPFDDTTGIRATGTRLTHLRVHNGIVRTPGPKGVGVALAPYKDPGDPPSPEDQRPMTRADYDSPSKTYIHSLPWEYQPPTYYTVENLRIHSGGRGVILSGIGNVLRNSVIEVDSPVAVLIYGPGAVIEGNTFIISRPLGQAEGPTEAALKLRDAHGAVIRNNTFLVKGLFAAKAEVAINLLESRDVVIEGNTVKGARSLVRKDAASSTIERGNTTD